MTPLEHYREARQTQEALDVDILTLQSQANTAKEAADQAAARAAEAAQGVRAALSDKALKDARKAQETADKAHADAAQLLANLNAALEQKRQVLDDTNQAMKAAEQAAWEQEFSARLRGLEQHLDVVIKAATVGLVTGRSPAYIVEQAFIRRIKEVSDFRPLWEAVAKESGLPLPSKFY